jgi:hypothetical protein
MSGSDKFRKWLKEFRNENCLENSVHDCPDWIPESAWNTRQLEIDELKKKGGGMKYKELPAFETNEFKVGDRVKVYMSPEPYIGLITEIENDLLEVIAFYCNEHTFEHFRQCRKLEEIKPREFWVHRDCVNNIFGQLPLRYYGGPPRFGSAVIATYVDKPDHQEYIRVQEILEDEE